MPALDHVSPDVRSSRRSRPFGQAGRSLLCLVLLAGCAGQRSTQRSAARESVLAGTPLIDGHVDLLIHFIAGDGKSFSPIDAYDIGRRSAGQVDLPRLRAGGVSAGIFTVGGPDEANAEAGLRESVVLMRALAARHPDALEVVTDSAGLTRAVTAGRIAALLGLEGGDQLGGSLDRLRAAFQQGVRAVTLTWERTNALGDSNADTARFDGLSPFGEEVVREMNRLGMLVDLSHAADSTAFDVLELSKAPVILSHSSARALCPAPRNASDELLRRVARNGGVVMVTFVPYFTTPAYWAWYERGEEHWKALQARHGADKDAVARDMARWDEENPAPTVTVQDVADHVDHVRRVAGADHVGLGSDFDGMDAFRIKGLEDAATFPALLAELVRRGWTGPELRKLAGENFLRVLRAVEGAREPPALLH